MEEKKDEKKADLMSNTETQVQLLCSEYSDNKITLKNLVSKLKGLFSEEDKVNCIPFDIEKAINGRDVCTRDGRKVRIICFDREFIYEGQNYCILALINDGSHGESVYSYTEDGLFNPNKIHNSDLMILPEKKEGWVNVYRDCDGVNITKDDNIYSSKDAAISSAQVIDRENYIATAIIKWEE